ncbi:hypothetical protein WICMUC_005448 [Wickerhamomyces mucosus]|uniref:3-ketodihydrosphingosine reductase TSC10 n=1 Tax=Wickerhamomyces mucosus TaxID=1378264 RepID=A0A9P8T6N3_9ASCO|nr:hypothetical protein WICMUC_005448 [Wickerhamomyces mucosus]
MLFSGQFDVVGKKIVITGGSQGLGAELGKQLIIRGAAKVSLIARTESKLKETVLEISSFKQNQNQIVDFLAADISSYESCSKIVDSLDEIDVVFFCAGSSIPKLFLDLTPKELSNGVNINYNTALYFAHAALLKMKNKKVDHKRHFIFCSSVLAIYPFIGYGQYAPLKSALRSLADILRHETIPFNIKVHCVYPGNFASEGFIEEEKTKPEITKQIEGPSSPIPVEDCTKIVLWFLDRGYETIFTDVIGWILSCTTLGMSPRVLSIVQIFLSLVLNIIAPFYTLFTNYEIKNYFIKQIDNSKDK